MPVLNVAIVGAGWAGMAAAVTAAQAGHRVTVFEASRQLGGRARAVAAQRSDGAPITLDNGQHILIGAYAECLRLMRAVGVQPERAFLRLPLTLTDPAGAGLRLPHAAPPWDALWGIARARGWSWGERAALLARAARWRLQGFACAPQASVADLCAGLPPRLLTHFIDPLCVSALNTPARQASGQVFLRVLHDSLFAGRGGSHLLLPRTDMAGLFPAPAAAWLQARGHALHLGRRVQRLQRSGQGWVLDEQVFDAAVLATPAGESARLVAAAGDAAGAHSGEHVEKHAALHDWAATAQRLRHAAIATVYAEQPHARGPLLSQPMVTLQPSAQHPAQFAFDRAQLDGSAGVLAFVVSAFDGDRGALAAQVLDQARAQLGLDGLRPLQTVVEKRATFVCSPSLQRPPLHIAPGLLACGDYVDGPYPATLEGAVRHGVAAAHQLQR